MNVYIRSFTSFILVFRSSDWYIPLPLSSERLTFLHFDKQKRKRSKWVIIFVLSHLFLLLFSSNHQNNRSSLPQIGSFLSFATQNGHEIVHTSIAILLFCPSHLFSFPLSLSLLITKIQPSVVSPSPLLNRVSSHPNLFSIYPLHSTLYHFSILNLTHPSPSLQSDYGTEQSVSSIALLTRASPNW